MANPFEIVQKDAIDQLFKVTVEEDGSAVNISGCTTKDFIFRKPSGEVITRAGSFFTDGGDGILVYESIAGDLDEVGFWDVQLDLAFPAGYDGRSSIGQFYVEDNL